METKETNNLEKVYLVICDECEVDYSSYKILEACRDLKTAKKLMKFHFEKLLKDNKNYLKLYNDLVTEKKHKSISIGPDSPMGWMKMVRIEEKVVK